MASDSLSRMVLLIASLLIAAVLGGVVLQYSQRVSNSIKGRGHDLSEQIMSDITIVSDPQNMFENENINGLVENYLVIYVKNTGSTTLDNEKRLVNVFLDGEMLRFDNLESMEVIDYTYWRPAAVVRILTDYTDNVVGENRDHSVKVVTLKSEDKLKFRV